MERKQYPRTSFITKVAILKVSKKLEIKDSPNITNCKNFLKSDYELNMHTSLARNRHLAIKVT